MGRSPEARESTACGRRLEDGLPGGVGDHLRETFISVLGSPEGWLGLREVGRIKGYKEGNDTGWMF